MGKRFIYIIGSAIIGIVTLLAVLLVLIATGVIDAGQRKLIYRSADAQIVYDGNSLLCEEYSLLSGKLKSSHTVSVDFTGIQTDVGTSENSFSVTILDEQGANVTEDYELECIFGTLEISKRPISITTGSATKIYDGAPLTSDSWVCGETKDIVAGHTLTVKNTGSQIDVGNCKNTAIAKITDADGKDVTFNYDISTHFGDLSVTPRAIQIRSGSAIKEYDGVRLTCDTWEIVSITKPLETHTVTVAISGQQYEIGESDNTIAQVLITDKETGANQNHNYDITYKEGILVVKGVGEETDYEVSLIKDAFNSGSLKDTGLSKSDTVVAQVYSDKDGSVYLRAKSYGDYTGNGWEDSDSYHSLLDERYSYNYLSGIAMRNDSYVSQRDFQIKSKYQYLLPYYLDMGSYNYDIPTSDVSYVSSKSQYDMRCFSYSGYGSDLIGLLGEYSNEEAAYSKFVGGDEDEDYNDGIYSNIDTLDSATIAYLNGIISQQGFKKDDDEIVRKVAEYIQNCARYNIDYPKELDEETDIVLSFLRDYKQGVCRHYASAATLLYRALGIPARYTVGILGKGVIADRWTDVPASSLHAWVEVYIDGLGWISVEVTGGPNKYANTLYTVRPIDTYQLYSNDTKELMAEQKVRGLSELENAGYIVDVQVSGSQIGLGKSQSEITKLVIYDKFGFDVTKEFTLKLEKGIVQIYKSEVTVTTDSARRQYDGTALTTSQTPLLEGYILGGDRVVTLKCNTSITGVGQVLNMFDLVIENSNGEDVTSHYRINRVCGVLEITQRDICIVTGSDTQYYDAYNPQAARSESWNLKDGSELATNDVLRVLCVGEQTEIGETPNYVDKIYTRVINKKSGEDVTRNYRINYEFGILKVVNDAQELLGQGEEA